MTKRRRRANFTATEKAAILREHLLEGVPVSEVRERHGIQPSQFYTWQKQLFENGSKALVRDSNGRERQLERENERAMELALHRALGNRPELAATDRFC